MRLDTIPTGTVYTLWTVVEKLFQKDENGYQQYVCKCKCGVKDIVTGTVLHRGRSLGCKTCVSSMELLGLVIGSWKIVEELPERTANRGKHIQYRCVCQCGFEKNIPGTKFRGGRFPLCPACKVKASEKTSHQAVTRAKRESEEFQSRRERAKQIYESNINIHLKIILLENFLNLLQRRQSFFMIELNGDNEEFDNYCQQLEKTHEYITDLKNTFIKVEPVKKLEAKEEENGKEKTNNDISN